MTMVIRRGYKGDSVAKWQTFLRGLGYGVIADGDFGPKTEAATVRFQQSRGLRPADGIVGNKTLGAAMAMGYEVLSTGYADGNYPEKPEGCRAITHAERLARFGSFEFEPAPTELSPEAIRITSRSPEFKIAEVHLPQLVGVSGFPRHGKVLFHAKAADQLVALVAAWEKAGLLKHILTWGGSYVARYVRGSHTTLSNHSWGTAFDINAAWNGLGRLPERAGQKGSVCELVSAAYEFGFYWGGHFSRPDGMHFEIR